MNTDEVDSDMIWVLICSFQNTEVSAIKFWRTHC